MLERQIPDREGLILCITGADAALVFVVELAQAGRHFSGAGAGCSHDHDRAGGLHIVVFAVALVGDDEGNVGGVVFDGVVAVDTDAERLQLAFEEVGGVLTAVLRDDDASDIQPDGAEGVDQTHDVHVIGDAEVAAALVHFNVRGVDGNDDLRLIAELEQHFHFAVRLKAGKHAGGMVIVDSTIPGYWHMAS